MQAYCYAPHDNNIINLLLKYSQQDLNILKLYLY